MLRRACIATCSRLTFLIVLAVLSLPSTACGPRATPTGRVTGTVTYRGKPVTEGDVNFSMPQRGIGYVATIDLSGRFTVPTPLEVGTYAVTVSPPVGDPDVRVKAGKPPSIPLRAQDERTSGLSVTVTEGQNTVSLEIRD